MDEAGALAALKAHRTECIDLEIARYGGRIVKLMGDGAPVEFSSVVDVVECAVAVQQGMAKRNADVIRECPSSQHNLLSCLLNRLCLEVIPIPGLKEFLGSSSA